MVLLSLSLEGSKAIKLWSENCKLYGGLLMRNRSRFAHYLGRANV